jgi:RimJ/RimL family protein N-acetyltransferase
MAAVGLPAELRSVMEFYPSTLTAEESDAMVDRITSTFSTEGLGLWALEAPNVASFVGYVGLWPARFDAPFTPAVEVGWRLAPSYWGRGYATEAARTAVDDGFRRLALSEIVSFTAVINRRSRRVMERLGMTRDPQGDFDHPALADGNLLRPHVLYRLDRSAWRSAEEVRGPSGEAQG